MNFFLLYYTQFIKNKEAPATVMEQ